MTSSFSIQDLLANDNRTNKVQQSPSNSCSPNASPCSTTCTPSKTPPQCSPTNTPPCNSIDTTPCSSHLKKTASPKQLQVEYPFPEVIEVTVLEAGLAGSAGRRSRKRCRDDGSLGSSSESEGSLSPALSSVDSSPDSGNKTKRLRTAFTTAQLKGLEHYFRVCPYPDNMGRDVISRVTGIDESKIQVWFQNRRARYRKHETDLKPPNPYLSPLPTPPAIPALIAPQATHPHTLTAPQATQPHTFTSPQANYPCTVTAPQATDPRTVTEPKATQPHHFMSAMLKAYYTTLAYQAYCAHSTPSPVTPTPPHPHPVHYPGLPFPYHFLTPSPATQSAFSSYQETPSRQSPSSTTALHIPETD